MQAALQEYQATTQESYQTFADKQYVPVVQGCFEVLTQAAQCLLVLSDEDYQSAAKPHVTSTIGGHFRHWLDVFHAVKQVGIVIDYNQRRRGHEVETSRAVAMEEITQLIKWITSLSEKQLKAPVNIVSEVTMSHTNACFMSSTLEREITFATLHANHHFAMVKVAASLMGKSMGDDFGIAPATATFLRGQ